MSKNPRLHQIIAIEKGIKNRVQAAITAIYHTFQKPALFNGVTKVYAKRAEDGEDFPAENVLVQKSAEDLLAEVASDMTELFDIEATKDWANCVAKANVVVDGQVFLAGCPTTYLLFLDKALLDMRSELSKLPELDTAETWVHDPNARCFRTPTPTITSKTKKLQKPIVMYAATTEHPAQTQMITEDVTIGTWTAVKSSTAVPAQRKKALLARIEVLIQAVKFAREEANETEAPRIAFGKKVFDYLLA